MRIYICAPTPPVPRPAWASAAGSRATTPPRPNSHPAIAPPTRPTNRRRWRGSLRPRSVWQHDRHDSPQGDRPELRNLSRLSKLGGPAQLNIPCNPRSVVLSAVKDLFSTPDPMPLHLIKMAVGAADIDQVAEFQRGRQFI